MPDFSFPEFDEQDAEEPEQDISHVFKDFLRFVANKGLRIYKGREYIHESGKKEGQSLYSHIMDLVSFVDRLQPVLSLGENEMRCVLTALSVHDINKVPEYSRNAKGWTLKYADAAVRANIEKELVRLGIDDFFPEWKAYLLDIVFLAHAHQAAATGTTITIDQRYIDQTKLGTRLKGPLKYLMQAADVSDNSHSGDYRDSSEIHLRDKLLTHINAIMERAGLQHDYRFVGHRLAELRGLFTNIIHNQIVAYFREKYGRQACIDLQYYPEGVNYLLDRHLAFEWDEQNLQELVKKIQHKLAAIRMNRVAHLIQSKPDAITVDDAAMNAGIALESIFEVIALMVMRKTHTVERKQERESATRKDLEDALSSGHTQEWVRQRIEALLTEPILLPDDIEQLQRGDFIAACRKFLQKHCAKQLKPLKEDAWHHVYRLFQLPADNHAIYDIVDSYRRGYFAARDMAAISIDEMKQIMLQDLEQLRLQGDKSKAGQHKKEAMSDDQQEMEQEEPIDATYLFDYLKRNLEVWDSAADRSVGDLDFGASLRQYTSAKRQYKQCCYCGSALEASEWMAPQAPPRIGVQSFSNRLEAGTAREPKRNVCEVCRMQFILDKLTWHGHSDKYGEKQVTFYLHLFPYAYFTRSLLRAWWLSVERLRDSEHSAFFFDTRRYFRTLQRLQADVTIEGKQTVVNGLNLPILSEAISNTPVLPIVAPGANYGQQYMLALEKAVILVRWFECRAILTRSAIPPLNLSYETINDAPVVLMVDGRPRNLSWLIPQTSMARPSFDLLTKKLCLLHQIAEKLYYVEGKNQDQSSEIPHDFAVAAADDVLALYFEADRWIEKKVAATKNMTGTPEHQAIYLSKEVAPLLDALVKSSKGV